MKKYRGLASTLMVLERTTCQKPRLRQLLNAAPLVVVFLLLNTRAAHASCSFNPTPDPTVDGSPESLRAAMQMANVSGEDCTIELQAGTYTLTIKNTQGQENDAAEGDLDINSTGHMLTIKGQGPRLSIVNGNGIDRVFQVLNGTNAVFSSLTITGGVARDNGTYHSQPGKSEAKGGGVFVEDNGHVKFTDAWIDQNEALGGAAVIGPNGRPAQTGSGGGVFLAAGKVDLIRSKMSDNGALGGVGAKATGFSGGAAGGAGAGGGLYVHSGSARLFSSMVSDNKAHGGTGGRGLGCNLSDFCIDGGAGGAAQGAGLFVARGTLSIERSTISGNSALGGTAPQGATSGLADGAGLFVGNGNINLANTTLFGNTASVGPCFSDSSGNGSCSDAAGGGMYISSASVSLAGVTIASNQALGMTVGRFGFASGGGIANVGATSLAANATLIADNISDSGVYTGDVVSGPITLSYSLISQSTDALLTNDGGNVFDLDPNLDPGGLKFNGGPNKTIALERGSPAINAVPLEHCTDLASPPHPLTIDQRGFPRPDAGEQACDMGAYESR